MYMNAVPGTGSTFAVVDTISICVDMESVAINLLVGFLCGVCSAW